MSRIPFISAGSTMFARNLLCDIISFPELRDVCVMLEDVDEQRLDMTCRLMKVLEQERDRGYDDGKFIAELWDEYGIKPVIGIRNLLRGEGFVKVARKRGKIIASIPFSRPQRKCLPKRIR
jgi:hypothetical protein